MERDFAYEGCRDSLQLAIDLASEPPAEGDAIPPPAASEISPDELNIYEAEYQTCLGVTVADIARDYGINTRGQTQAEVVLEMERQTYGPLYEQIAYEACLDAMNGEPPRYGSNR